jgi:hypothetical protein
LERLAASGKGWSEAAKAGRLDAQPREPGDFR